MNKIWGALPVLLLSAVVAVAGNVGPMLIQQYGADVDNPALFWTNIGGGAAGRLSIGAGLSNSAGALTAAVQSVFGRTGAVTLQSSDVTGALGFSPLNKAGDTLTGLLGTTVAATASAAGTNQGTATAIAAQVTVFTTVAPGAGAVLNNTVGAAQVIFNRGGNPLTIYPFSGAQIEGYGVNNPVAVAVGGAVVIRCASTTQCFAGI